MDSVVTEGVQLISVRVFWNPPAQGQCEAFDSVDECPSNGIEIWVLQRIRHYRDLGCVWPTLVTPYRKVEVKNNAVWEAVNVG